MEFKREPIEFFVVESEDSNEAVIDFIGIKHWRADDVDV
jgi:hypothetical protein